MTRSALTTTATQACHNPCGLPYHRPGSRVQWQVWDRGFVLRRGRVVAHADRTLTIEADGGYRVTISCGPVVAEVGE